MAEIPADRPLFVVIGGPNGSGKSTVAATVLPASMTFINADEIAKGLPSYPSSSADLEAGRLALDLMDRMAADRADFAFETTLASRSLAARAAALKRAGYHLRILFVWSPSPDLSVARVAARVLAGGHNVPEDTIRRRYRAGLVNFQNLYRPLSDSWSVYDNTTERGPRLIAEGVGLGVTDVAEPALWARFQGDLPDGE